jgi:hypothetical protein
VCVRCSLNQKIHRLKSSSANQPSLVIDGIRGKTLELSMTEKFHTQKFRSLGELLYEAYMSQKGRGKNRWKK